MSNNALQIAITPNQGQLLRLYDIERVQRHYQEVWDTSQALRSDPYSWETALIDPKTYDVVQQRIGLTSGFRYRYRAASERPEDVRKAAIFEHLYGKARRKIQMTRRLGVADFRGKAFEFVEGRRTPMRVPGVEAKLDWWHPTSFCEVATERFVLAWDEECSTLRWQMWSFKRNKYEWLTPQLDRALIKHVFDPQTSNMFHGTHLLDAINLWLYIKGRLIEAWAQAAERWGQGFIVVSIDELYGKSKSQTPQAIQLEWQEVLKRARAEHGIVISAADKVDRLNGPGEGFQVLTQGVALCDESIRIAALSTSMGAEAKDGAFGHGREAEAGMNATHTNVGYSRRLKAEDIDAVVTPLIERANAANWERLGLADAAPPTFELDDDIQYDPEATADLVSKVLPWIRVAAEDVREKLGFRKPEPNEETIGGANPVTPGESSIAGLESLASLGDETPSRARAAYTARKILAAVGAK